MLSENYATSINEIDSPPRVSLEDVFNYSPPKATPHIQSTTLSSILADLDGLIHPLKGLADFSPPVLEITKEKAPVTPVPEAEPVVTPKASELTSISNELAIGEHLQALQAARDILERSKLLRESYNTPEERTYSHRTNASPASPSRLNSPVFSSPGRAEKPSISSYLHELRANQPAPQASQSSVAVAPSLASHLSAATIVDRGHAAPTSVRADMTAPPQAFPTPPLSISTAAPTRAPISQHNSPVVPLEPKLQAAVGAQYHVNPAPTPQSQDSIRSTFPTSANLPSQVSNNGKIGPNALILTTPQFAAGTPILDDATNTNAITNANASAPVHATVPADNAIASHSPGTAFATNSSVTEAGNDPLPIAWAMAWPNAHLSFPPSLDITSLRFSEGHPLPVLTLTPLIDDAKMLLHRMRSGAAFHLSLGKLLSIHSTVRLERTHKGDPSGNLPPRAEKSPPQHAGYVIVTADPMAKTVSLNVSTASGGNLPPALAELFPQDYTSPAVYNGTPGAYSFGVHQITSIHVHENGLAMDLFVLPQKAGVVQSNEQGGNVSGVGASSNGRRSKSVGGGGVFTTTPVKLTLHGMDRMQTLDWAAGLVLLHDSSSARDTSPY